VTETKRGRGRPPGATEGTVARLVYDHLTDGRRRSKRGRFTWPAKTTMAAELGIPRRTLDYALSVLQSQGLVRVSRGATGARMALVVEVIGGES
jgi:DNA-binding transcriptional ArsR family regulator